MNRRLFLKSIATACGAAVVCPGELVKLPEKHKFKFGEDMRYSIPYWVERLQYETTQT